MHCKKSYTMIQVFLEIIIVLKNYADFNGKQLRWKPSDLQLYYKETLTQVFSCKILRTPFSAEQLRWLLFKVRSSNKSVQRCFTNISFAQHLVPCSSHSDKLIWKCIKLVWQSVFVAHLEQTPFFLKSNLNINDFPGFF